MIITWASYQIRKIARCACVGNAGNVFPRRRFQRKPIVSDPGMHHGTCVTHVPWCMSGSLTCGDRKNVPGIPGACAPAIVRIWQEAHSHYLCRGPSRPVACVMGSHLFRNLCPEWSHITAWNWSYWIRGVIRNTWTYFLGFLQADCPLSEWIFDCKYITHFENHTKDMTMRER